MDENGAIESLLERQPILGVEAGHRHGGARGIFTPFFFGCRESARRSACFPALPFWDAGFSIFSQEPNPQRARGTPERDLRIGRQA